MTTTNPLLDTVLDRFDRVRRSGDAYMARCPAHDDRTPSLRVSLGEDGRVLLHCFAGCNPEDVVVAAGMAMKDLFPAPERPMAAEGAVAYEYVDVDSGELIATHHRLEEAGGKTFWWTRNGRRGLGGIKVRDLPLYRARHLLVQPVREPVVLVEGEKPADALSTRGVLAVGTGCGANVIPADDQLRHLLPFDVVLWPDNDGPGALHMQRVGERLRAL